MVTVANSSADLPDPVELVQRAIAADLDPSVFTERAFPVAKNSIEFCSSHKFLNASDPLWPRQFQVLARFFEDVCYFCSDVDYVYNVPVDDSLQNVHDRFCLLEHGICPRCKRNRLEILSEWQRDLRYAKYYEWDEAVTLRGRPPNEFNGIWGQRSGKSYAVATFFWPYILHRYLAIPNITSYLRLASNTVLEAVFVSPILEQLKNASWQPFMHAYDASPWFSEFTQFCKDEENKVGIPLYHRAQTYIAFPAKRLSIQMRAASSSTLRGGTRIFTCIDGDALVNTTKGLVPIKQDLSGMKVWVKNEAHDILRHSETGRKPVQKTILEDGYSVTTTLDHKLKVLTPDLEEVWKEAQDLKIGDYVAVNLGAEFPEELKLSYEPDRPIHRQLETCRRMAELKTFTAAQAAETTGLKGIYALTHRLIKRGMLEKTYVKGHGRNAGCVYEVTDKFDLDLITAEYKDHAYKNRDTCTFPTTMTPELGYLLGYYVAEGSYAKGAVEFSFSNTDEAVIQHFISCFEAVFGFTPRVSSFEYEAENHKIGYNVAVAYKVVKKFLRYLGMEPSVARTKAVPWSILQAPKDVVLAFLSAYIEGDGSISDKYVTMVSTSRKLIQQLQLLFLRLGLVSTTRRQNRKPPYRTLWQLRLRRYDSIKLVRQLTCPTKGKLFNFKAGKRVDTTYRIPFLPAFVDTSLHGGSTTEYAYVVSDLNADAYNNYALKRLEWENIALYAKAVSLIDTGVIWLSVVKKKQLGSKPVFDITVDSDEHAFVANGIVAHNCVDELGWFSISTDNTRRSGVKDGTEVFTALDRSLLTVRSKAEQRRKQLSDYDTVDGYMFCASSPSSISDPIEQRAALASKSPLMMHTRYPTWQVHPEISEELVRDITAGDPVKFKRDYGAEPPRAASPFLTSGAFTRELVDPEHTKNKLFTYEIQSKEERDTGISLLRPVLTRTRTDKVIPRVLTVDNGEKSNSFALCLASYYPEHDGVLFEEFLEVAPHQHHQVDLQWCYDELIVKLVRSYNILHVFFDQWESSYAIRDLRNNYRIDASQYSLKWKDFERFRDDIRGARIWFPVPEVEPDDLLLTNNMVERARSPRAHFQVQLTTVNQFGKKVTKPDNGNDDLFRCAVLAHWAISNNKDQYRRGMRGRRGGTGSRQVAFSTAGGRYGERRGDGMGSPRRAPRRRQRF